MDPSDRESNLSLLFFTSSSSSWAEGAPAAGNEGAGLCGSESSMLCLLLASCAPEGRTGPVLTAWPSHVSPQHAHSVHTSYLSHCCPLSSAGWGRQTARCWITCFSLWTGPLCLLLSSWFWSSDGQNRPGIRAQILVQILFSLSLRECWVSMHQVVLSQHVFLLLFRFWTHSGPKMFSSGDYS